ncbi:MULTISPECIES: O-succinylhomoserine sulfhydrylase [unclassified Oleiphilus]|jgi:O-succinylhomoserine sulfhydrylase|uniref:O-succinylhomoserine sulfhydrylase n=7 Tax=Oleiphilus TaxID=141450 RepID=UPI0007C2F8A5|nr:MULTISPECIES: O-succinylhomoserine sulfhydrylase [unclassified Oleiphilus]KZY76282.1 O-succinylhomoserine sulfhydrylase [Oleiphilus sp. HI0069]KZY77944.1 O-succinylhomoserine sulfhydrylase [Oleiphilus sp. HI0068]KZY87455.1 O-succinylhomoserine sulfhydrylase [Oleiphilus sp. HI0072]KZY29935.1 O-succinylhomoserine sulfhydrylase [Oleiphilus sp. HI0043]KZY58512.1 O-succinylhomoserine sulfhydrylase [Oleiphilus sp. HI0061]
MANSQPPKGNIPVPNLDGVGLETLAVRAGQIRSPELEHSEAIFPTSSFVFNSAQEAAARFAGEEPGNIYARFTNPTVAMFEARLAALEGGERGVAAASGMAAIMSVCYALLEQGDHVICSRSVFGTTTVLLEKFVKKFGVEISFVDLTDYEQWQTSIKDNTRFLFLESPSNPLCEVVDIARLAELARQGRHSKGCLLVVDNCMCTPILQQPLKLGADIVVHSATKYIDGQGRCLGGAVVGSNAIIEEVHGFIRSGGAALSPFNAWVMLKGLETLSIRMKAHGDGAMKIAQWLSEQAEVDQVFYSGLASHPQADLVASQQTGNSGVLSFKIKGDKAAAWRFIDALEFVSITANLGDAKSTITHPATTTHGRLSQEDRDKSGISDNLIRISVGLESTDDLIADLSRGIAAIA